MFFKKGILPIPRKENTLFRPIASFHTPESVLLPLSYANEQVRMPACEIQDTVVRGTPIGIAPQEDCLVLPCSITGTFTDIQTVHHPLYGTLSCARILAAQHQPCDSPSVEPSAEMTASDIIETARKAGIIDERDGVALYQKLSEAAEKGGTVIADATQAEPYGTAALALLWNRPDDCIKGTAWVAKAVGTTAYRVAVQLPWPLRRRFASKLPKKTLYNVANRYPVPAYAPMRSTKPVHVIGLGACVALYDALYRHQPACSATVTVSGDAVEKPCNLCVPYGTSIAELLRACQIADDQVQIILGDAFTGVVAHADLPVLPGMSCILVMRKTPDKKSGPCIGCGRCVRACHAHLLPYEIARRYENLQHAQLADLHTERCDGCGACSVACPMARPLSETVRQASAHGLLVLKWRSEDG